MTRLGQKERERERERRGEKERGERGRTIRKEVGVVT